MVYRQAAGHKDYRDLIEKKLMTEDEFERLTGGENAAFANKYFVVYSWACELLKLLATGGHLVRPLSWELGGRLTPD